MQENDTSKDAELARKLSEHFSYEYNTNQDTSNDYALAELLANCPGNPYPQDAEDAHEPAEIFKDSEDFKEPTGIAPAEDDQMFSCSFSSDETGSWDSLREQEINVWKGDGDGVNVDTSGISGQDQGIFQKTVPENPAVPNGMDVFDIVIIPNNFSNIDNAVVLSEGNVTTSDSIGDVLSVHTSAELDQKWTEATESLTPDVMSTGRSEVINLLNNSADVGSAKEESLEVIDDVNISICFPEGNNINVQTCTDPTLNKIFLSSLDNVDVDTIGDFAPKLAESDSRNPDPNTISDAEFARKLYKTLNPEIYSDAQLAIKLSKAWNTYPDMARDASGYADARLLDRPGNAMDISGDRDTNFPKSTEIPREVDITRQDTSGDAELARALAVPDTSGDAEFARSIAKHFGERTGVNGNTKSPLDSVFNEEKIDFPGGICETCYTPCAHNLKLQLRWVDDSKCPENGLNGTLLLVKHNPGSKEMAAKVIGDHVSDKKFFIHPAKLEDMGSPCNLCGSFTGSTDVSTVVCSVIRRSNVAGRKAVNFDLAKQFIDMLTKLSPSFSKEERLPLKILYHWTNKVNFESILDKNLIVPGNQGIKVANGSALGVGIYTSETFEFGRSYGHGIPEAIMVLGLLAPNEPLAQERGPLAKPNGNILDGGCYNACGRPYQPYQRYNSSVVPRVQYGPTSNKRYNNFRVKGSVNVFFKSELVLPLFLSTAENRLEQEEVAKVLIDLLNKVRPIVPKEF